MIRNEPDAFRRHALERRLVEATAAQNPLRERRWDVLYAKARELGYPTYRAMVEDVGRLDVEGLAKTASAFLRETERHYRTQLARRLHAIGVFGARGEERHRVPLPRAGVRPLLRRRLARRRLHAHHGGPRLHGRSAGTHHSRHREAADEIAARLLLRAAHPGRGYLISPQGGEYDYSAMFHEGGHSQHFAHAAASLPFALRGLGDNSVTEGFAFVLEHIIGIPDWLEQYLFFHEPARYLEMQLFNRLYMFRRYAAKLIYESELHASPNVRGHQKRYADLLTAATGARYSPEDYLFDVDDAYYCARYLRAWIFDAQLRGILRARFGEDWYADPAAGAKLIELWSHGQRFDAPTLLAREGLGGLDIAPLVAELAGQVVGYRL
jgi:hypothetical protein